MAAPVTVTETAEKGRSRFEIEAEFVSLCADPAYLRFLGAQGYISKPAFLEWLHYIVATWSQPAYARHLLYPQGLAHLACVLRDGGVRDAIAMTAFPSAARSVEFESWRAASELDVLAAAHAPS